MAPFRPAVSAVAPGSQLAYDLLMLGGAQPRPGGGRKEGPVPQAGKAAVLESAAGAHAPAAAAAARTEGRPVLLLHGLGHSAAVWAPVMAELAAAWTAQLGAGSSPGSSAPQASESDAATSTSASASDGTGAAAAATAPQPGAGLQPRRLYALDLPGHGDSTAWESASVQELAEEVAAAMAHLEPGRCWDVVGMQTGGCVALALALRDADRREAAAKPAGAAKPGGGLFRCGVGAAPHGSPASDESETAAGAATTQAPEGEPQAAASGLVGSLLLCNTYARFVPADKSFGAATAEALRRVALLIFNKSMAPLANHVASTLYPRPEQAAQRAGAAARLAAARKDSYLKGLQALSRFNVSRQLHRIACPALVVAGGRDPVLALATAEKLFRRIPDSRLAVFSTSSHGTPLDQPAEFARTLAGFLAATSEGREAGAGESGTAAAGQGVGIKLASKVQG